MVGTIAGVGVVPNARLRRKGRAPQLGQPHLNLDDTFILFKHASHAPLFLNYLNNQHQNIAFTIETEQNQKLPFLDVVITRSNNKIRTSVYRKPTFSGQGLSFFSFCTLRFKLNSIKTFAPASIQHLFILCFPRFRI